MKLPSSPIRAYSTIYISLIGFSILLDFIFIPVISSSLIRFYFIDFVNTCVLFFLGNYVYSSNNIYDLHWPLIPFLASIYFHISNDSIEFFSMERLPLFCIISLWSYHLSFQTLTSSDNIQHEDWRYQSMRKDYKQHFQLFAFLALHCLPMLQVLLGSSSIYYIYLNTQTGDNVNIMDIILLMFIFIGVLIENLADRQLNDFRRYKSKSKQHRFAVLSTGLWKHSRHPNYLGELIFWWGLFLFGYLHQAPFWCALGPFLITLMMLFGSIPMSEERLYRKYPEYKFFQQKVSKLVPTFGLFE